MEPVIIRARKFLAFLAPDSGASQGEREAAQMLLDRLLAEHKLTLSEVEETTRFPMYIIVKDLEEGKVVSQLGAWIRGEHSSGRRATETIVTTLKNGKKRWSTGVRITFEMTAVEYADWLAAWNHYRPDFIATRKALKDAVRLARIAEKKAAVGFVHRHDIFPPPKEDDGKRSEISDEDRKTLMDAIRASKGQKWQRPAGTIGDGLALMR